jgi:hypothetical protein
MRPLSSLAAELRSGGGLIADSVSDPTDEGVLGHAAAEGPRAAADPEAYAQLVEAIHEGYLQHYGEGRVVRTDDPDLALLAGDRLYALGLARLAALGDLEGVAVLADLISLAARLHAEGRGAEAPRAWKAAVADLGHGREAARQSAS